MQRDAFGQLQYIVKISLPSSRAIPALEDGTTLILALIRPCTVTHVDASLGTRYFKHLGPLQAVDVDFVEGVVGRVRNPEARNEWAIIEREGIYRRIRLADEERQEREAATALAE